MKNSSKEIKITSDNYLKYFYDIPYEGTTSQGKPLKKLKNITCPYRGIKIIPADCIKSFEKALINCQTSQASVELLENYKKNLLTVEKQLFAIFKDFAKLNPDDNLQNCLLMIKNNCHTKLKLEELEVLDEVDRLSHKLSAHTALKLRAKTTKCRTIIINDCNIGCFKRKTFLNSLEEITPNPNEREIFANIKNKALFLPTSESSKNAFVVKYSTRTHQEITRRLFIASTGSIEHIITASLGGLNTIGNFLLTSASGNRYRENMPLVEYIKRFPKIPTYCQSYINDIIEVIHQNGLKGYETYPYKIKERLLEASQGHIMISLSNYKYSKEEAIEASYKYEKRFEKFKKIY
ncbi:hypothetical protein IJ670_07695 [bacterium]|nr:hypothetical protein [bacterium]